MLAAENPTSSSSTISTLGAPLGADGTAENCGFAESLVVKPSFP
ncbi:hypothetical protein AK972_3475 [Pseudomonas yamanorum]|nr:hypothetical protein AK972_3475 [Pseudomonas yamanorum]